MMTFHSKIPNEARSYSVKDMAKYIKSKHNIDFYELSYDALKTRAINNDSYLLDIACDIKELLQENTKIKYEHIGILLDVFSKASRNPLEQ